MGGGRRRADRLPRAGLRRAAAAGAGAKRAGACRCRRGSPAGADAAVLPPDRSGRARLRRRGPRRRGADRFRHGAGAALRSAAAGARLLVTPRRNTPNPLGGYASTHAVLASVWLQENGCEVDARRLAVSRDEAVRKLVELLDGATAPTDLRAEALAMLNYAGQPALAGARHVAALLDVQRDDGGWALAVDRDASHPHTTALALWVLLEARHPQRTRAPMISRPVGN